MMGNLPSDYPWLYEQYTQHGYHSVWCTDKAWAGLWTDLTIEQTMMRSVKSIGGLKRGRGMNESVRDLWVSTLHCCGEVEQAMHDVTKTSRESSEQHVELGSSRSSRDFEDLKKVYHWLEASNPFDVNDQRLRSLSTGLAAKQPDNINCDQAEEVGEEIQRIMDNQSVIAAKVPTKEKVRSLVHLTKAVKIGTQTVHVDPLVLFMRLLVLVERAEKPDQYFSYELAPYPPSLFKDNYMRHINKALLAQALKGKKMKTAPKGIKRGTKFKT